MNSMGRVLAIIIAIMSLSSLLVGCRDVRKDSLNDNITVESKCEHCK